MITSRDYDSEEVKRISDGLFVLITSPPIISKIGGMIIDVGSLKDQIDTLEAYYKTWQANILARADRKEYAFKNLSSDSIEAKRMIDWYLLLLRAVD